MDSLEIKKLIISSLDKDSDAEGIAARLADEGVAYDFSAGFSDNVIDRISGSANPVIRQLEFTRYLNTVFSRVAFTGVAAILLLLISIFLMEGNLSFDSILGIADTETESMVYLISGN